MLIKKKRTSYLAMTSIVVALVIYIFWAALSGISPNQIVVAILIVGLLLLFLKDKLFQFRVQKGFYGTSESEAREIIKFIVDNFNHIDFRETENRKQLISKTDIKNIVESAKQLPLHI